MKIVIVSMEMFWLLLSLLLSLLFYFGNSLTSQSNKSPSQLNGMKTATEHNKRTQFQANQSNNETNEIECETLHYRKLMRAYAHFKGKIAIFGVSVARFFLRLLLFVCFYSLHKSFGTDMAVSSAS